MSESTFLPKGQSAVVTGAGGFLGRTLVARLARDGTQIRAITRSATFDDAHDRITTFNADVRDAQALTEAFHGAAVVFHLAAHTHDLTSLDDSRLQDEITLGSTIAALTAAEAAEVPNFVFASSLAVFGEVGAAEATEDTPCAPTTPYGRAKLRAEEAVRDFGRRTGRSAACIRPAMIYGVGCPGNLPRMIAAVQRGTFPPLPEFGNKRSMIAVDDVARAFLCAWRANVRDGRPFIVTDGRGYSTRELYDLIRDALGRSRSRLAIPSAVFRAAALIGDGLGAVAGRRMPFDSGALTRLAGSALFSNERASREIGFAPTTTLPDVIGEMIAHVSDARLTPLG